MITVAKLHNTICDFVLLQGKQLTDNDPIYVRVHLPTDALNALMSNFSEVKKHKAPVFEVDEDNMFYTTYKWFNVTIDICEGKTYRIEKIEPNQEIEQNEVIDLPILPGREPILS